MYNCYELHNQSRAKLHWFDQFAVEVTLYIQSYNELNPRFTVGGWSPTDPTIRVVVVEELPFDSTVLQLSAMDSPSDHAISHFMAVSPLPAGFALYPSGLIKLTRVFDFENLENKVQKLKAVFICWLYS